MTNQELKDKNYTNYIESEYLKDLPDLSVGESVRLGIQIVEGNRERTQYYEGVIIAMKNMGINKTITVRKVSQGVGIERIFLLHSPKVVSIEKKKLAKVIKRATYLLLWYWELDDLTKKINKAPIVGSKINDDRIGKFILFYY